jgi:hypothetical protein
MTMEKLSIGLQISELDQAKKNFRALSDCNHDKTEADIEFVNTYGGSYPINVGYRYSWANLNCRDCGHSGLAHMDEGGSPISCGVIDDSISHYCKCKQFICRNCGGTIDDV